MSTFEAVFPPGCVVCHHPHCDFTTSKQKMLPAHTFLEDKPESMLEVPLLCWDATSSSRNHTDS